MKFIVLISLLSMTLLSNELLVKDSDVEIMVNKKKYNLKVSEKLSLNQADVICFVSGKGRIVINGKKQLQKRSKRCYQVPLPQGSGIKKYIKKAKNMASVAFLDSSENVKKGVSTRGFKPYNKKEDLLLKKDATLLVLHSKTIDFSSKVVFLKDMRNKSNEIFETDENSKNSIAINRSLIRSAYTIEIKDKKGKLVFSKRVFKEEDI